MTSAVSLTQFAIESLHAAATVRPEDSARITEARGVWQPDSWIIQRCWQVLAEAGNAVDAMAVASLAAMRHPLAPSHALYTLAKLRYTNPKLAASDLPNLIRYELAQLSAQLFSPWVASAQTQQIERLLYAAASASAVDDEQFAFACLERLDQFPRAWDRIFVHPEMRTVLAETITRVGLHPLTNYLIDTAIRDFQDAGAQFIQQIATTISIMRSEPRPHHRHYTPTHDQTHGQTSNADLAAHQPQHLIYGDKFDAIMARCIKVCRNTTLTSLHSRRIAATILAQAGLVDETLEQVHTIATIQDAHRETNQPLRNRSSTSQYAGAEFRFDSNGALDDDENSSEILRQVARTKSDSGVDFLVSTLKRVVDVLPIEQTTPEQRAQVGRQLAALGGLSDGWTAAGAASSLVKLGGIQDAIDVVDQIRDATHSEGSIELVSGLLETGQEQYADMQAQAALAWARSLPERMPERATIWGMAEAYLDHHRAERAIQLLDALQSVPTERGFFARFFSGDWSGEGEYTDEDLRSGKLRLRAYLQREMQVAQAQNGAIPQTVVFDEQVSPQTDALIRELCGWAPQLLEGEALINFYLDGILEPLLEAEKSRYAWGLLPQFREALLTVRGTKHAARVVQITKPLAQSLNSNIAQMDPNFTAAMRRRLEEFSVMLWQDNSQKGIWQAVYGVDGSLPMLLVLEGPDALVEIANAAANEGALWSRVDDA